MNHIPCGSIQFRLWPFDFDYFDSVMQNIDVFLFLQHDTQCKQPTTLNSQFEDTIVTGTLLIYYKDAIKKKHAICQFSSLSSF